MPGKRLGHIRGYTGAGEELIDCPIVLLRGHPAALLAALVERSDLRPQLVVLHEPPIRRHGEHKALGDGHSQSIPDFAQVGALPSHGRGGVRIDFIEVDHILVGGRGGAVLYDSLQLALDQVLAGEQLGVAIVGDDVQIRYHPADFIGQFRRHLHQEVAIEYVLAAQLVLELGHDLEGSAVAGEDALEPLEERPEASEIDVVSAVQVLFQSVEYHCGHRTPLLDLVVAIVDLQLVDDILHSGDRCGLVQNGVQELLRSRPPANDDSLSIGLHVDVFQPHPGDPGQRRPHPAGDQQVVHGPLRSGGRPKLRLFDRVADHLADEFVTQSSQIENDVIELRGPPILAVEELRPLYPLLVDSLDMSRGLSVRDGELRGRRLDAISHVRHDPDPQDVVDTLQEKVAGVAMVDHVVVLGVFAQCRLDKGEVVFPFQAELLEDGRTPLNRLEQLVLGYTICIGCPDDDLSADAAVSEALGQFLCQLPPAAHAPSGDRDDGHNAPLSVVRVQSPE